MPEHWNQYLTEAEDYEVHMISFRNKRHGNSYSAVECKELFNLMPWHIPVFEKFLNDMKRIIMLPVSERNEALEKYQKERRKRRGLRKKKAVEVTLEDLLS